MLTKKIPNRLQKICQTGRTPHITKSKTGSSSSRYGGGNEVH